MRLAGYTIDMGALLNSKSCNMLFLCFIFIAFKVSPAFWLAVRGIQNRLMLAECFSILVTEDSLPKLPDLTPAMRNWSLAFQLITLVVMCRLIWGIRVPLKPCLRKWGAVDSMISTAGLASFTPLAALKGADYELALANKLMDQINLLRLGQSFIKRAALLSWPRESCPVSPCRAVQ